MIIIIIEISNKRITAVAMIAQCTIEWLLAVWIPNKNKNLNQTRAPIFISEIVSIEIDLFTFHTALFCVTVNIWRRWKHIIWL